MTDQKTSMTVMQHMTKELTDRRFFSNFQRRLRAACPLVRSKANFTHEDYDDEMSTPKPAVVVPHVLSSGDLGADLVRHPNAGLVG